MSNQSDALSYSDCLHVTMTVASCFEAAAGPDGWMSALSHLSIATRADGLALTECKFNPHDVNIIASYHLDHSERSRTVSSMSYIHPLATPELRRAQPGSIWTHDELLEDRTLDGWPLYDRWMEPQGFRSFAVVPLESSDNMLVMLELFLRQNLDDYDTALTSLSLLSESVARAWTLGKERRAKSRPLPAQTNCNRGGTADILDWRERFGLTRAECRVCAGLVRGLTMSEIAEQHGVSINTVRAQLQTVFGKTGASRQGQLILILMNDGSGEATAESSAA